jgi:uncharacterized protein YdhG (YjbR/CyaY superfamily)
MILLRNMRPPHQIKEPAVNAKIEGFSADERAAMKERARELKANASKEEATQEVLAKIAELSDADRPIAERLHELITSSAPSLSPKTWYGMPAYAGPDGKIVCFFQGAEKFKTRYATLGFSDQANLDDGDFWPNSFAINAMTPAVEARVVALVKQATTARAV